MSEPKMKRPVARKSAKAGNAPEPTGPMMNSSCGHSSCGMTCKVRYVGNTSHMRDHFIMHAARGATHIWSASVVTGLAIVLTGTIAYSAVQAKDGQVQAMARREAVTRGDLKAVNERLANMEKILKDARDLCSKAEANGSTTISETDTPPVPPKKAEPKLKKLPPMAPAETSTKSANP